jgi:hypothetical protein
MKLRKLYAETRDPVCKTVVNCMTGNNKSMFRKRTFARWETGLANCEVTPQAKWSVAEFLRKSSAP